jgi:hypothetical protein
MEAPQPATPGRSDRTGRRADTARKLIQTTVFILIGIAWASVGEAPAYANPLDEVCGPVPNSPGTVVATGRASLKPVDNIDPPPLRITSRDKATLHRQAHITGAAPPVGSPVLFTNQIHRSDGKEIPFDQVTVHGCVMRNGDHVYIEMTVNPTGVPPGEYRGQLTANDPAFETSTSTPVDVTVIVPTPNWWPFLLLALAAVGAVLWQDLLRRLDGSHQGGRGFALLGFFAGLAVGAMAVVPVYIQQYSHDPAWILDMPRGWGLVSTGFIAATTAIASTATIFRRSRPRRQRRGPDRRPTGTANGVGTT